MTTLSSLLSDIEAAPPGPGTAALFDLDRTLIAGFSAQDVLLERALKGDVALGTLFDAVRSAIAYSAGRIEFVEFVNRAAADLAGRPDADNIAFGQQVFDKRVAQRIYPEARTLIAAHRKRGHTLGVISSATPYQVEPVARDLGIEQVMCTRLEVQDGLCTGRVVEACYGEGKAVAARNLAARLGLDLSQSFFYSDGNEDLPLLEIVGKPKPLNPDARLTEQARRRGWPVTRFDSRRSPTPVDLLRMGLAFGAALPAGAFGLADYVLNGSAREARNLFNSVWGELASAAIDLKLEVTGEEHLWSARPAVFVFNHQSALDTVVMMKLLRRDITAIAKKEIASQPVVGQIAAALGAIFIDRADSAKAVAALRPAVDALKSGTSVVIAPEGTRSTTNHLGAFKKGAFHLAIQARVPMIAVVIRNTTDWMPKGALLARPGTVEVKVLPPIDTRNWTTANVDARVATVRDLFLRELEGDAA
ncbi:MAG: HAD-IB family hydrolase [Gammaproteobacteria bacterium]|nr:HAD-IB family hydrolase [Gammaproteobacteria bacterium]